MVTHFRGSKYFRENLYINFIKNELCDLKGKNGNKINTFPSSLKSFLSRARHLWRFPEYALFRLL